MSFWLKFMTVILVFYTPNQLHFPSSLGVPGLNVLNAICLVLWLSHSMAKRPSSVPPEMRSVFFIWFAALFYGFILSQITSYNDILFDLIKLKTLIFYPLFFFIFYYVVRSDDDIRIIVYALLAVAFIAGLEAIKEWIDFGASSYKHNARAAGPFGSSAGSANRAGSYYAIFLPLALVFALSSEKGRRIIQWGLMAGPPILAAAIFATYSRQAYIIGALSAVIFSLRRGPIAIVLLIGLAATYQLWIPETAIERIVGTQQVDDDGVESVDASTQSRFVVWAGAMRMFAANPAGVGLNRFQNRIGQYLDIGDLEGYDAHNYYVRVLAETGPIGIFALVFLVLKMIFFGRRLTKIAKNKDDKFGRLMGISLTLMSVNMILTNVYGSPFAMGEVMGLYWAYVGLCARRLQNLKERTEKRSDVSPEAGLASPLDDSAPEIRKRPRRRLQIAEENP